MNKTALTTLAAFSLLAASSAFAAPTPSASNLVTNGSFEELAGFSLSNGTWGQSSKLDGWKIDANISKDRNFEIQLATNYQTSKTGIYSAFNKSYDGAHYLELNANSLGAIYQQIDTTKGASYTLTFGYSGRSDSGNTNSMDVLWNGKTIASLTAQPGSGWQTYSYTVAGSLGDKTTLEFVSKGPSKNASYGSYIDGVSVTAVTAVPEPESYAMLLAGLGVMATIARRRRLGTQA